ncbi:MAG: type IV pilus assembly protein PilM [Lentisphaeria bacterium]
MASSEKILAIDIGSTSIKLCEFEFDNSGIMKLNNFAYREYENELSESTRIGVVSGLLRQMLAETNIHTVRTLLSISGQSALIRFGKIPASGSYDKKQIKQLAEFEARRNIPFAIDEVIWDYQLIVGNDPENVDVMSVVIKEDIVEQYTKAVQSVGLDPILVDVAPVACYNAAKGNDFGVDECVIILNIGGRSSNLIFIEGERFFARTIPIAGYSITQQIAKEFNIGLPEAEELKRHHGFVALGGAYAETGSETAINVSKIIRNVMARLHGEVSRSISIYRGQQKGHAPTKMYLTGGSSVLTYCDVFFSEKLSIPVKFFNPFSIVSFGENIDRVKLEEVAHMFSEVIGLALRYYTSCPVEISLLPASICRQQSLNKKKPFLIISMFVIVIMLGVMWQGLGKRIHMAEKLYSDPSGGLVELRKANEGNLEKIQQFKGDMNYNISEYKNIDSLLLSRTKWPMIISELYRLKPDELWLTSIKPVIGKMKEFDPVSVVKSMDSMEKDPGMGGGMMDESMLFGDAGMGMGMGMDMGMGMGKDAPKVAVVQSVTIGGLELVGNYVMAYPGDCTYTVPPELNFPFEIPEKVKEEAPAADFLGGEEKKARPLAKNTTPEEIYVANLRKSRLFSSDAKMTVLKSFKASDNLNNLGSFTIQVKFEIPMSYNLFGSNSNIRSMNLGGGNNSSMMRR